MSGWQTGRKEHDSLAFFRSHVSYRYCLGKSSLTTKTHIAEIDNDRRDAIRHAIFSAASDDLVLIAGKGHEDFQHVASGQLPFSDQYQVRSALLDRQDGVR